MTTTEFIFDIIEKINGYGDGSRFKAVFSHSERPDRLPVDKVYIAFSPYCTDVSFFDDENSECCKRTVITVKCSFYCSAKKPLSELSALCDEITDRLQVDYEGRFSSCKMECLAVDDNLRLMELPGYISFEYEQCPAYSSGGELLLPYADFMCKTHVRNEAVHLSPDEKAYINEPFVLGAYVGTGTDSKIVNLGFKPRFVFVVRANSFGGYVTDENGLVCCCATLNGSKATNGIRPRNDGFIISMDEEDETEGISVKLNMQSQTYMYIALR